MDLTKTPFTLYVNPS